MSDNDSPRLFVPPGHFYSPIVNVGEIRQGFPGPVPRTLPEIAIHDEKMIALWDAFLPSLREIPFPETKTAPFRFYFANSAFAHADATILYAVLRHFRPRRYLEVGSGFSSACAIDTIDRHLPEQVAVTFVEPHPELLTELVGAERLRRCEVHAMPVQRTDAAMFSRLTEGDVLLIDSTHVLKTGSDVSHELFSVLPSLAPGVLVQFHDVFWPFEYPEDWVLRENRSWNEIYALRAFLSYNTAFEIIFFNDYFCRWHHDRVMRNCPAMLRNTGGSIWLRKLR